MNKKDFKELQQEWYKKLKEEGFEDLELDNTLTPVKHGLTKQEYKIADLSAKMEFARFGGQFLHDYTFRNEFEKTVWELHLEGNNQRETANILDVGIGKINTIVTHLKRQLRAYVQKRSKEIQEDNKNCVQDWEAFKNS